MNDESNSNIDVPKGWSRKLGSITDKGKVRETDEDCVLASSFGGTFGTTHLLVVADGMGGHAKGEVASKKALERIWIDSFSKTTRSNNFPGAQDGLQVVFEGFRKQKVIAATDSRDRARFRKPLKALTSQAVRMAAKWYLIDSVSRKSVL